MNLTESQKQTQPEHHLTVALLIEDLREGKELTFVFKKVGVHPYIYTDLKSFWQGTLERLPSLCIVDVKMMSEGPLLLKNHPYVKTEQMPLAFFYGPESKPLLFSTYEMFNLGTIRKDESYVGQVKGTLRRLNKMIQLEEQSHGEAIKNSRFDRQISRLMDQNEQLKEKDYYRNLLTSVCQRFELRKNDEDFFKACEAVFSSLKEVEEFAYLELSTSGQKLVAPESRLAKYRKIPSLWLGQVCTKGIEFFAQNMASQVGVDLMGGELMSLAIKGRKENPETLVFLKLNDQEMLNHFDWEGLERYLSGLYSAIELKAQTALATPQRWMQPFELLSLLDQEFYKAVSLDAKTSRQEMEESILINVSFSGLVKTITEKGYRFYWKLFQEDFLKRLQTQTHLDFKVCLVGVENIAFWVSKKDGDQLFSSLKSYSARFPFWKYFEDADLVLAQHLRPVVQQMPTASRGYLKQLLKTADAPMVNASEEDEFALKNQTLWRPDPQQSM